MKLTMERFMGLTAKLGFLISIIIFSSITVYSGFPQDAAYRNHSELSSSLKNMAAQNPDLIKLTSLAKSQKQRDVWLLTLTDFNAGFPDKKPALLIVANLEGNLLVGSELVLRTIQTLSEQAGQDTMLAGLLRKHTLYFVPRLNPDGAERMFLPVKWESAKNLTGIDEDNDGNTDEDAPDDLNRDGMITMMRVKDPAGQFIPDTVDSRLMRKADPAKNELGVYQIFSEGKDNDGDEEINEDPEGGVDLNKNFPIGFNYFEDGSGIHQVSEAETRGLADFLVAQENIAAIMTYSANDNLINPPPLKGAAGEEDDSAPSGRVVHEVLNPDAEIYQFLSKNYKEITGLSKLPVEKTGDGTFSGYGYFGWGIISLATPGWQIPDSLESGSDEKSPASKQPEKGNTENEALALSRQFLKWYDAEKIDAFLNWQPVSHPDFPDSQVEIGGFHPFRKTNPPEKLLTELAEKHSEFVISLLKLMPDVRIESFKIKEKNSGMAQIEAVIRNRGFLPTNTALGARMRLNRPTKAALVLNGQKILTGKKINFIKSLEGSGGTIKLSWTVQGKGEIVLKVDSPKGGQVQKRLKL